MSPHGLAGQQSTETTVGQSEAGPDSGHAPELKTSQSKYFVKALDMRSKFGFGRAASPSKRLASERDDDNATAQAPTNGRAMRSEAPTPATSLETPIPDRSKVVSDVSGLPQAQPSRLSIDATTSDDIISTQPPRSGSSVGVTHYRSSQLDVDSGETPSYDEQVQTVKNLIAKRDLEEGLLGYLVAKHWFIKVISRTSDGLRDAALPKSAREGSVGPVDNSIIADLCKRLISI